MTIVYTQGVKGWPKNRHSPKAERGQRGQGVISAQGKECFSRRRSTGTRFILMGVESCSLGVSATVRNRP